MVSHLLYYFDIENATVSGQYRADVARFLHDEKFSEKNKKTSNRGKKEYDKKRIVEILVFGVCIQLRRIVLRGVQREQI